MNDKNVNLRKLKHGQILTKITAKIDSAMGIQQFAILTISLSQLLFPLGFLYVSEHEVNPITTNLARGITTVITHGVIFLYFGISFDLPDSRDLKLLLARCTIVVFHQLVYTSLYYALSFAVLNTLAATGPLFVFILDYLINAVTINRQQLCGIVFGILGVVVTINGDGIMTLLDDSFQIKSDFKHYKVHDIGLKALCSSFLVLCNVGWAYSVILQKRIAHVSGLTISLYMGVEFIVSSGLIYSSGFVPPLSHFVFTESCVFTGLVVSLVQLVFITCLNLSKNSGLLTLSVFLGIVTSELVSHYKYGEKSNAVCVVGMVLLVYGIIKTTINKAK